MELGMRELMRLSDVRRWHTVRVACEQTLADHSCRVALIAMRLYQLVVEEENNADVAALLTTALLHDAAEVHLGDPPPAGKTTAYAMEERSALTHIPLPFGSFRAIDGGGVTQIIKVADRIEAWLWIRENAIGEHSLGVINRCFLEMERVAAEFKVTEPAMVVIEEITRERIELCPF